MQNVNTAQIVSDAKATGAKLLADAQTAGESFLTAIGSDTEAAVPTLTTDAENTLLEFVPSFIRPYATAAAGATVSSVEAAAIALIKAGVGIALTRLEAL